MSALQRTKQSPEKGFSLDNGRLFRANAVAMTIFFAHLPAQFFDNAAHDRKAQAVSGLLHLADLAEWNESNGLPSQTWIVI
jgi:hypothetical protein